MELDLVIFARRFAAPLGIGRRFVGTEPQDQTTAAYNRSMKKILPGFDIEVVEIPRLERGGRPVSAGRVRELLDRGDSKGAEELVPPAAFEYLAGLHSPAAWQAASGAADYHGSGYGG
jgi:[citrate (pro-3S)-lyase] ligase